MKKISAHKKRAALAVALVLGFQLLTGTGFFCVRQSAHASRTVGGNLTAAFGAAIEHQTDALSVSINADDRTGTQPCTCKKKKKCPTIPRVTLTSNPTHRFHEVQLQLRSVCCDSVAPDMNDHRFTVRGAPRYMESKWGSAFCSFDPLSIACVLLI